MKPSLKVRQFFCVLHSGLLFISGVVLVAYSSVLAFRLFYHFNFTPNSSLAPVITIFLLGFLNLCLTWLGIRGPSNEHDFHIFLFLIATGILLVVYFGIAVWSLLVRQQVGHESLSLMGESFEGLLASDLDKSDWVRLQTELKCCGIHGPADYTKKASIPLSCCNHDIAVNSTCPEIYDEGCKNPLMSYLKRIFAEAAIVSFTSTLVQVVGILAFCYFVKELKRVRSERAAAHSATLRRQNTAVNSHTPRAPSSD